MANSTLIATKSCEAYNNMKHTTNTSHIVLQPNQSYTSVREYKGQHFVIIPDASPRQRWVDSSCFGSQKTVKTTHKSDIKKSSKVATNNLLALSWHNAFCQTHQYKKECKRKIFGKSHSDDRFVLHGLWPQPRDNQYCRVEQKYKTMDRYKHWDKLPSLGLSRDIKAKLTEVMPGVGSNLHKHEWFKHGTCYGKDAIGYFEDAIKYVDSINHSRLGVFFATHTGKKVSLNQIRKMIDSDFGKGAGNAVEMRCNNGMITEFWFHLKGKGDTLKELLQTNRPFRSSCRSGFIDKAGFGR